jgi:hypothetical protein
LVIQEKAELCYLQKTCNCLFCSLRRMMTPELIHTWCQSEPDSHHQYTPKRDGWWVDTGNTFPIDNLFLI